MRPRKGLSFGLIALASGAGVVSGNFIFGPALAEYWANRAKEDQQAAEAAKLPSANATSTGAVATFTAAPAQARVNTAQSKSESSSEAGATSTKQ